MPIDPSLFDDKKLQEEEDSARAEKAKYATLGAIGDNLANRQSFGNFFLGHMNPHQDGSAVAKALGDSIEDPAARQKQLLERYQSKMAAQRSDREEKDALESSDPLSEKSKTAQSFLKSLDPKLAASMGNMSDAQIQANFKNPAIVGYLQQQRDMAKLAQEHKNKLGEIYAQNDSKVPKGFEKVVDPETGEVQFVQKAGSFKPNQYQAALYGQRAVKAGDDMGALLDKGFDPTSRGTGAQKFASNIPLLGGFMERYKGEDVKKQEQAESNFLNAILRRESGAAISQSEKDEGGKQYFPRPGDTGDVLKQKADNRRLAAAGLRAEASGAWDEVGSNFDRMGGGRYQVQKKPGHDGEAMAGQGGGQITPHDIDALKWVKENPKDPRAADIVSQLKQKGLNP